MGREMLMNKNKDLMLNYGYLTTLKLNDFNREIYTSTSKKKKRKKTHPNVRSTLRKECSICEVSQI